MPDVIAESRVDLDSFMADWRSRFYGQHNPQKLGKITKNLEIVREHLSADDSLLDVGCNSGEAYSYLKHKNYEGIDISPESIKEASAKYPEVKFRVCDLFDLEGLWDVVLVSRVLMHVAPFELAMKRLLSVSRKCIVFVQIADVDYCQLEKLHDDRVSYFRRFSEKTMYSAGKCVIVKREPYSTVIYG